MAVGSRRKASSTRARNCVLASLVKEAASMADLRPILLVEDNLKDIELTLAALAKCQLANDIVVARDGAEALDYLYSRGQYKDRLPGDPAVVLLDLKLPKVDG